MHAGIVVYALCTHCSFYQPSLFSGSQCTSCDAKPSFFFVPIYFPPCSLFFSFTCCSLPWVFLFALFTLCTSSLFNFYPSPLTLLSLFSLCCLRSCVSISFVSFLAASQVLWRLDRGPVCTECTSSRETLLSSGQGAQLASSRQSASVSCGLCTGSAQSAVVSSGQRTSSGQGQSSGHAPSSGKESSGRRSLRTWSKGAKWNVGTHNPLTLEGVTDTTAAIISGTLSK